MVADSLDATSHGHSLGLRDGRHLLLCFCGGCSEFICAGESRFFSRAPLMLLPCKSASRCVFYLTGKHSDSGSNTSPVTMTGRGLSDRTILLRSIPGRLLVDTVAPDCSWSWCADNSCRVPCMCCCNQNVISRCRINMRSTECITSVSIAILLAAIVPLAVTPRASEAQHKILHSYILHLEDNHINT